MECLEFIERDIDVVNQKYVLHNKNEIIISTIPPLAKLKPHSHEASQFGTSLQEGFLFYINDNVIKVDNSTIYNLDSNITHSAYNSNENKVISLDVKYFPKSSSTFTSRPTNLEWEKIIDGFYKQYYQNNSFSYEKFRLGSFGKYNFSEEDYDYIIPLVGNSNIAWSETAEELQNFTIYKLDAKMSYSIKSVSDEIIFVCLKFK